MFLSYGGTQNPLYVVLLQTLLFAVYFITYQGGAELELGSFKRSSGSPSISKSQFSGRTSPFKKCLNVNWRKH